MNAKEIIEQARERSRRLRVPPIPGLKPQESEDADTIDTLIAEVDQYKVDFEEQMLDNAALRAELASIKGQEPVAWLVRWLPTHNEPADINPWVALSLGEYRSNPSREEKPLFLTAGAQPAQERKPLNQNEILEAYESAKGLPHTPNWTEVVDFVRAIEAKIKEKTNAPTL
ncbi:MAG: hypothetical protein WC829_09925 [Hyphomicrobium sp.]|jgi:hypothetical protein